MSTFATLYIKYRYVKSKITFKRIIIYTVPLSSPEFQRGLPSLSRQITSPGPAMMAIVSWARRSRS